MPAGGAALLEHPAHLPVDRRAVGEQHRGVEVALHRVAGADAAGGLVQRHPPVDTDDVGARVADQRQQLAGADAEVDPRDVVGRHRVEDGARVRQHPLGVVGGRQHPGPRVEQLHRGGAGLDLGAQERRRGDRQPVQQPRPRLGLGVHERLGAGVLLRRAALDQVGGQGERRPGEADQRRRPELGDQGTDGGLQERQPLRLQRRQRVDVGDRAHRGGHDRPDAGLDLDVDPGDDQRQHDVGEQDRRVDAVPAHRLQRDLGDQVGVLAGLEHRRPGPQRAVLRQ